MIIPNFSIQDSEPEDENLMWVDSSRNYLLLVYDQSAGEWIPVNAIYG